MVVEGQVEFHLQEKSLSAGFAYQTVPGGNPLGVAYNFGVPNESTWGPGLDEQHTLEVFYRAVETGHVRSAADCRPRGSTPVSQRPRPPRD